MDAPNDRIRTAAERIVRAIDSVWYEVLPADATDQDFQDADRIADRYAELKRTTDIGTASFQARTEFVESVLRDLVEEVIR